MVQAGAAHDAPDPRGTFVDIGGRRLRAILEGPKADHPLIVLESGSFGFAADWAAVQASLAARGLRSLAYDRAGMGYSEPGPAPRDGIAAAQDLESLLEKLGEEGPLILVGHSMAGLRVWLFAGRNPGRTAGIVMVDAATPEASSTPDGQAFLKQFGALSQAAAWSASVGLLKPIATFAGDMIGLPAQAEAEKRWAFAHGPHNRTSAEEVAAWTEAADQAAAVGPPHPDLPVAVVTAGRHAPGRLDVLTLPARNARRGYVAHVPEANHASLLGLRHGEAIVKAIEFVRSAAAEH